MNFVFRIQLLTIYGLLLSIVSGCSAHHGINALQQHYPPTSQRRDAANFLVTNLPKSDRVAMSRSDLLKNVDMAFMAREKTPWGQSIPFDIFKHYVLPHRLINEPYKPYREEFYKQLMPLVRQSGSILEAAIRVNLWCASQVEYRPSSFWLTAPSDMRKVGFGRCEELAVFFAAAARSVGIPVRGCWVPAWRHTDDNHVWVEIWDNGEWIPLEAGSTIINPNENWFLEAARSAPAVYSPVYGHIHGTQDKPIYRRGEGYTTLNLTKRYVEAETFTVTVLGQDGLTLSAQQVYLWTYNSGMLYLVAQKQTDHKGIAHFLTGGGSYIASTGDGRTVTAKRIETSGPSTLDLRQTLPKSWTWPLSHTSVDPPLNRYPSPKATPKLKSIAVQVKTNREVARKAALEASQAIFINKTDIPLGVRESIQQCWPSAPRLAAEYAAFSAKERKALAPLLQEISAKDLPLISMQQLSEHLDRIPDCFAKPCLSQHTTEFFYRAVANPRIYGEPIAPWSQPISSLAASLRRGSIQKTVSCVISHLQHLPTAKRTPFSPPLKVAQMLTAEAHGAHYDTIALGTAILRSLGIPALINTDNEGISFLDEGQWQLATLRGTPIKRSPFHAQPMADKKKLCVLTSKGLFFNIHTNREEPVTFLPDGILMEVEIKESSHQGSTGYFEMASMQ